MLLDRSRIPRYFRCRRPLDRR